MESLPSLCLRSISTLVGEVLIANAGEGAEYVIRKARVSLGSFSQWDRGLGWLGERVHEKYPGT